MAKKQTSATIGAENLGAKLSPEVSADQARLIRLQVITERMSLLLKVMTSILGFIITLAAVGLLWGASRATGLVIHAFSVPPELTQRGFSGETVANQLLDRVRRLDESVDSVRAPSSYANGWDGTIAVEIPNTGVSVDELSSYLRAWLGNQTDVRGEIFRSDDGYALAVRVGKMPGAVFQSSEDGIDQLLDQGAEAIFRAGQPYRYATYLRRVHRGGDAAKIFQELIEGDDEFEHAWGHVGLANLLLLANGDRAALRQYRIALSSGVSSPVLIMNMANRERRLGLTQVAADHISKGVREAERKGLDTLRMEAREEIMRGWRLRSALVHGDARGLRNPAPFVSPAGSIDDDNATVAAALVAMHRPGAARAFLTTLPTPTRAQQEFYWINSGNRMEVVLASAADEGDWPGVLKAIDKFIAGGATVPWGRLEAKRLMHWRARALAQLGQVREAKRLISTSPTDCYPCFISRGWVATMDNNGPAADRWFAIAVRQAPRLHFAHTEWGRSLLVRGDTRRAVGMFRQAHRIQPHSADPLKYWGDALATAGDLRGAVDRYAAAASRTPHWGALHLDWGIALSKSGRSYEASDSLRAASTMELSRHDLMRWKRAWTRVSRPT